MDTDKISQLTTVSPGEYLKRKMALAGLTAQELGREIGVHAQTIYHVTAGKRRISHELAVKLAQRFVEQTDVWLSNEIELAPVDLTHAHAGPKKSKPGTAVSNVLELPLGSKPATNSGAILIDREIAALLSKPESGVSIMPYEAEQIQPASFDLTVGLVIQVGFGEISEYDWVTVLKHYHEPSKLSARDNERIETIIAEAKAKGTKFGSEARLERLQSVVIIAKEIVQFDKFHLADVGGTARNALRGLLVSHGFQIDPGYHGAMFFTAINIGMNEILIPKGHKIASLALRKLSRAPDRAYHAEVEAHIRSISERLEDALKAMFEYKRLATGDFKAWSDAFPENFVESGLDEVQGLLIASILDDLGRAYAKPDISPPLMQAVHEAIEAVVIQRPEALALLQYFKVLDEQLKNVVLQPFRMTDRKRTLRDTLVDMQLEPIQCLVKLLAVG